MPERKLSDMSEEQLRQFIKDEVRKALAEAGIEPGKDAAEVLARRIEQRIRASTGYRPRNIEYKSVDNPELPAWARNGQWS